MKKQLSIGDLVSIWNGNSSISDPKNWLLGIVVKKRNNHYWNETRYQIQWNDLGKDDLWYSSDEVKLDGFGR